jgi:hypothetical protein
MYRHGDVFLAASDSLPEDARKLRHVVLAEGEITGHAHRVRERDVAELFQHGDDRYLNVFGERATLIHEEHAEIELPRGIYRVWIQREYSPEAIRRVVD